jgi:hypothetical protein
MKHKTSSKCKPATGTLALANCNENFEVVPKPRDLFLLLTLESVTLNRCQQHGGDLLVSYNSQALQEICFYPATAAKVLGEVAAASLQARHADMEAADNVFDLPVGNIAVDHNLCTLTVSNVLSIVMSPNYAAANDGTVLDWSTVRRIKLVGINDVE